MMLKILIGLVRHEIYSYFIVKDKKRTTTLDVSKSTNSSYTLSIPNDIDEFKLEVLR